MSERAGAGSARRCPRFTIVGRATGASSSSAWSCVEPGPPPPSASHRSCSREHCLFVICLFLLKVVHEIINWVLVRSGLSLRGFILCTAVKRIEGFFFFLQARGQCVLLCSVHTLPCHGPSLAPSTCIGIRDLVCCQEMNQQN